MKKCFSLLLTMAMLLSMVPAASATEAADIPEMETAVVETVSKEDLARELETAQLADAFELSDEEIAEREEARRARVEAELDARQAMSESDLDETFVMPEADALNASATDYTIKVNLKFSSSATRDTVIRYDFGNYNSYFGHWFSGESTLRSGSSSLTISVPVAKGTYNLEFYSNNVGWTYADIYGALSNEYDDRLYVGAFGSNKTIEVNIDGDYLLKEYEDVGPTGKDVKVTVKLPAYTTATESCYRTFLRSNNSTYNATEYLSSGKNTYTETFNTTLTTFVVGYYNATNVDNWYNASYAADARYISKDGGITTKYSEAKVFTLEETSSVTIDDSNNFALTGNLKLSASEEYDKGMYAIAEFENGEQFAGRAYFPAGSTSAKYTIYVPKSLSGSSFTHWAAETRDGNSNRLMENSYLEGDTYTLSGNASLKDITLPAPPVTLKGTFSLPAGMKAPSGGMNVAINSDSESTMFTLPAGKNSFDFELTHAIEDINDCYVHVYIENAPDNLCDQFYVNASGDELLNLELTAYETVIVSGTITVPEGCKDLGSTHRFYTYSNFDDGRNYNGNLTLSVLPGQTSAPYEIKVLKGCDDTQLTLEVDRDASGKLLSSDLRLKEENGEFTFGDDWGNFTLTQNLSGIDAEYALGKSVTGTISLADGIPSGYYYGEVYLEPDDYGNSCRNSFRFDGTEGAFAVAVPQDYTGSYRLYVYVYTDIESNALTDCQLYYTTSGVTTDYSEATKFTVPDAGLSDIDLVIPAAKTVSGNVLLPEGLPSTGRYYGNVYVRDTNGNSYSGYFNSDNNAGLTYTVKVPLTDTASTYTISVYCYSNDNTPSEVVPYTHFYLTEDGSMSSSKSDAKQFTIGESGLVQDVTIPKGETFTVTLNAPSGFSGDYSGRIYMYDLDDYYTSNSINFSFTNSGTVTFTVASGSAGNKTLYLRVDEGPGAVTGTNYYYADGNWVRNTDDAKPIDTSTGSLSVNLPAAKVVTINIAPPAGFSGDYSGEIHLQGSGYYYENFEFTSTNGSGSSVTFTLPDNDSATYRLRMYINKGEGVITGSYYYYTEEGTWNSSSSYGKYMTANELPTSVTMPAAKLVTINVAPPAGCSGNYSGYMQLQGNSYYRQDFEFTSTDGSGTSVTFTVPDNNSTTYRLYLCVYDGFGVMTNTSYYYAADGAWTDSSSYGKYMTADELPASVTLPAAKIIRGRLATADGSAINLGTSEDNSYGYVSLSAVSGSYVRNSSIVNPDGTFAVSIPENASGTHRIYFSPSNNPGSNLVSTSYYYAENATGPVKYSDGTAVDVSGEVPELTIYVETGYVVSGQVKLGDGITVSTTNEDGYLGEVRVRMQEIVEEGNYDYKSASTWVYMYQNQESFSYSMVLPKSTSSYKLWIDDIDIRSDVTTNMYIGEMPGQTVSVSGDTTLPDLYLSKAKATITVTAVSDLMAEANDDFYMYAYVVAGDTVYSNDAWLYSGDSITVTIPEAETSATYKLYYSLSNANGLVTSNVYVGANGVLSTKEENAASFSWSTTSHILNLLETPPYLMGKIYLPGYTDQKFSLYLSALNSETIQVTPDKVQTDEDGNKYLEYRLTYNYYLNVGSTFRLQPTVSYDSSVTAEKRLWADRYHYVNPDGSYESNYSYAKNFTVPEDITIAFDFALANWEDLSGNCVLQSAHNIIPTADPVTYTYTYVYPGISSYTRMRVYFNDLSDMDVTINGTVCDPDYSSSSVYTTDGTLTVSITVSSETHTEDSYYGFGILRIEPSSYTYPNAPAVAAVSTLNGSDNATVMKDLRSGKNVHVALAGPSGTTNTVIAAIYDSTGKMLDVEMQQITFSGASAVFTPHFTSTADAATLKIMLVDNSTALVPKMAAKAISG